MRRSFLTLVIIYGLIFLSLSYWQICANLQGHPANPRYYQMFKENRGMIFDRSGVPLASSSSDGDIYARSYAAPSLSHVVGYFHVRYGMTGLERICHEDLSQGRSLITTLDLKVQEVAEQALGTRQGAIVVLNPTTGEVLALVSSPAVDGNSLDANWSDYLVDERSPFLNRATHGLYPPGSIVKPIVYGAALRDGLVDENQLWEDQGALRLQNRTIQNAGGKAHGMITTDQAMAVSSNVVFAQIAISLGEGLLHEFRSFGLGQEVPFELRNLSGHLPAKVSSEYDGAQLGIGQGELLVTPLQMAMVVSSIANHGVAMRPFVVQEVRGGLKMRQITRPEIVSEALPVAVASKLKGAMRLAATEGTAQSSASHVLDYGGKTGTAQVEQGPAHAWFIGFAPTDKPRVAIAVLVEHGESGAQVAVPIGLKVLEAALGVDE